MEEENVVLPPYWFIMYVDDYGQKHITYTKNTEEVEFIETRYTILDKKAVAAS